MTEPFYTSPAWRDLRERVIARDNRRCTVSRLFGGGCSGVLAVHHIEPRSVRPDLEMDEDNLATTCASHHPTWEAARLFLERTRRTLPPCRHNHRYKFGREACERERARKLGIVLDQAA